MNAIKLQGVKAEERGGAGAVAASACRGLFQGVGWVLFMCFREITDACSEGLSDFLFNDAI